MKKIDIFIVGAQKTGSTSVFNWLKSTNALNSHQQREMSFFMHPHELAEGHEKAFERYFKTDFNESRPTLAKHAMAAYSKETLERIKEHNGDVKIIFIMREPISRAYSAFWYARKMGWEPIKTFSEALDAEAERTANYLENRNLCYRYNSQYEKHICDIFSIFKENQVLLLTDDDIKKGANHAIEKIADFSEFKIPKIDENKTSKTYNKGGTPKSYALARLISSLLSPNNPAKKILTQIFPPQIKSRIRARLTQLNTSNNNYPEITQKDHARLSVELSDAIKKYKETASQN